MSKETIFNKIKRFNEEIDGVKDQEFSSIQKAGLFIDFMREYLFHGAYLLDYIQYEFYLKRRRERKDYVVFKRLIEIMKTCNDPQYRHLFDNKAEFNKLFADFIQRDFLDSSKASYEDFERFLEGKKHFITKQHDGMFGDGISKIQVDEIVDRKKLFAEIKEKNILCEGVLTQCKEMGEFNTSSINSLRIVTVRKANNEVDLVGGLFRMGRKGKIVDNFHNQGIAAYLDTKHGIASTLGVDKKYDRYAIHPDSKKQIVGFKIPMWEEVVATVRKAADVVPEMGYMGWDIVITEDYKIAIVEGNPGSDPDAEQISTRKGRWPIYKEYLDEIKNLEKRKEHRS